jgi:uncharacterized membrane protein YdjX (TVP38/TMEM64 family)
MTSNEAGSRSRISTRIMGATLLVALALGAFAVFGPGLDAVREAVESIWIRLQAAPPFVYFAAVSLLTLLPLPISLFYVAAGPLYGVATSLFWIVPATIANNLIAHAVATSFLRPRLVAFVEHRGYSIPRVETKADQSLFIAFVRVTPGFPYFLQNLVLGLADVDRWRLVLITLPIHLAYATGFVVLGRSAFEGRYGMAAVALAVLVAASVCARIAYKRLRPAGRPETGPDES